MDQDDFDRLLTWLDPDRDKAAARYEEIRRWLIRNSRGRGRSEAEAEEIADKTIDRVARKLREIADTYVGAREPYFYGVWRRVILEPVPRPPVPPPAPPDDSDEKERRDRCLTHCLNQQPPEDRQLLLNYYANERKAKIEQRRDMARAQGLSENALRIRLTRLRKALRDCIKPCLEASGA